MFHLKILGLLFKSDNSNIRLKTFLKETIYS